ncbi:SgcJ/EcaC family oxidoreductase [Methylobacterium sp. J-030]|uniref:YybH family protein n=1 Tax=Methylobacterium sp. J-030 TaxID=2836627 RepID=UPI001FBA3C6F|nr:SgcJ/EcaC family oxidoreductase [Methylobacterium sp. J-030]MCJ2074027.1 SgcJ/EcaC family oxidoreductase [Methylobacterium sp. J-030]
MDADEQAIAAVLARYAEAANNADATAVAELYADDAVLMAQYSPPAVGKAAVHAAYAGMAGAIKLDIVFEIAEIRLVAPDWAFLRSTSTGTIRLLQPGIDIPEANQELFLFRKVDSTWKIARYSFSTVLPAQA